MKGAIENFIVSFGCLSRPLEKQFDEQGLTAQSDVLERWQMAHDAINILRIQNVLTDRESDKARQRLVKDMSKRLQRKQEDQQ